MITGIARAGIDALIALAVEKTPRGRTGMLCENPQVQDAVGRADVILNAGRVYRSTMIAELWNTIADGGETTLEQRARCRLASTYAADSAREAMDLVYRHGGSTSFKRESRSGGVLARSARGGADGHGGAGVVSDRRAGVAGDGCGAAAAVGRMRARLPPFESSTLSGERRLFEQVRACAGAHEDNRAGAAAVIDPICQQEIAADVALAMTFPIASHGMIAPFRTEGAIVRDQQHDRLEAVHVVAPGS